MAKNYVLGIDIGGTSIKIGVVDEENVIESASMRNVFKGKSETLLPGIKEICDVYLNKYNINKIGIGCPGDIIDGVVKVASNLGWKDYNILQDFKNVYPECEIVVENDGKTACKAEKLYGALANVKNGLFITIGRGVGGDIIYNGQEVYGNYNNGGKIGHMVICKNGRRCNCGRRGCFETYASVYGLIQTIKEINFHWKDETQKIETEKLSGVQIVNYNKNGSVVAKSGIERWNKDVSEGILNLCMIFDPSVIVIAGGITESGLLNLEIIKNILVKNGYDKCELTLAKFKGKSGLVGAASLVSK